MGWYVYGFRFPTLQHAACDTAAPRRASIADQAEADRDGPGDDAVRLALL
jgi:hypothetical protein